MRAIANYKIDNNSTTTDHAESQVVHLTSCQVEAVAENETVGFKTYCIELSQ